MHILDALQMIPFGLYFKKRKTSKYCDPHRPKRKKKENLNHDVIIACVIAPRAGLPQGGFE